MPKIDLCFRGWFIGTNISTAIDGKSFKPVAVSDMTSEELVEKLRLGDLLLSLADVMDNDNKDQEIELFDFEVHP